MTTEQQGDSAGYENLLMLEELESLLEELEDLSLTGSEPVEQIPSEVHERLAKIGVRDVQQIRDRIMHLHARLDEDDEAATITES